MGKQKPTTKTSVRKKAVASKAKRPSKKGGLYPSSGKKASRRSKQSRPKQVARKPNEAEVAWKSIFIQGEAIHTGAIGKLHAGIEAADGGRIQFDFGHLIPTLVRLQQEHPDSRLFVFGGSPESFDFPSSENQLVKPGVHPIPVLNVIVMPKGSEPPPFVAVNDFQKGIEEIKSFNDFSLSWKVPTWATGNLKGHVSVLACSKRMTATSFKVQSDDDLFQLEYLSLFTMRPSVDWQKESYDDSKLSIRFTTFDYIGADGEEITEEFDRDTSSLSTFIPDFIDRHDLDESHEQGIKEAIKAAFENARERKQNKMNLLDGYDEETLESIKVVKLYPRNGFVAQHFKTTRVNGYYGHAVRIV